MKLANGVILYDGPSMLDRQRIVVIATGLVRPSRNAKTGDMLQVWILRADRSPVAAQYDGSDVSICGDCPERPALGGRCYVNVGQAPREVWEAWRNGAYPPMDWSEPADLDYYFGGRNVRFGAYGDPAAVPVRVLRAIHEVADGTTGYTHQWRTRRGLLNREWCHASVASLQERAEAIALGWRTFRIRSENEPLAKDEFACPGSSEQNNRLACADCLACSGGLNDGRRATPAIVAHGVKSNRVPLAMA